MAASFVIPVLVLEARLGLSLDRRDGQTVFWKKIRNDEMVPTSADYQRRIANAIAIRPLQLPPRHM